MSKLYYKSFLFQVGAYLPFFREHSDLASPRREPYVHSDPLGKLIREALQDRQIILPFYYTVFFHHSTSNRSVGVIRPLVSEYPCDEKTFDIENQFLIGKEPRFAKRSSTDNIFRT